MIPNTALEFSIEQLISALSEKLFMECTKVKSTTPPVSHARVATLTAEVDALERRVKDILRQVTRLKNPLQPVNRLPPELIALCATFVSCTDPRPIITLTHVCRYWRGAIISSHRNWAGIGSDWKRLIPLCLERAGTVPLKVDISALCDMGDYLQLLLPHVSRISDLSLTGYSPMEDLMDELPDFFSPMPNLTSLKLEQDMQLVEFLPPNETPIPPLFQNISKLKTLHLAQVPLYPTLSNIPSLVELKLVDYIIPFGKFIGFLESNIALEIVILRLRFIKSSVSTIPTRMVSLPQLRHLAFTCDNVIDARGLFSWLSLPRGVMVEVRGSPKNWCDNVALFLPRPPTPIHELTPITIKYQNAPRELHLSGNNGSFSFYPRGTPPTGYAPKDYGEFDLFSTAAVREFHLNSSDHENIADLLPPALKRLPALETLIISRASLCSESFLALSSEPLLCRSLKTIALFECPLGREFTTALEGIAAKREHSIAARLHRVVIISDKYAFPDFPSIRQLRKLVPHVDFVFGDKLPHLL